MNLIVIIPTFYNILYDPDYTTAYLPFLHKAKLIAYPKELMGTTILTQRKLPELILS